MLTLEIAEIESTDKAIMPLRCYGQSWCKYRIGIVIRSLIHRDLHDQVRD